MKQVKTVQDIEKITSEWGAEQGMVESPGGWIWQGALIVGVDWLEIYQANKPAIQEFATARGWTWNH